MAKKIALRIWSIVLSSFSLISSGIPVYGNISKPTLPKVIPKVIKKLVIKKSEKPELFLQQAPSDVSDVIMDAGHRSHSSHRSHYSHRSHSSHRSHYSGSGGGSSPSYSPPKVTPSMPSSPSTIPGGLIFKKIYLKDGGVIHCQKAWQVEDKIYVVMENGTFYLPFEVVDVARTLSEASKYENE